MALKQPKKRKKSLGSVKIPFENGPIKDSSLLLGHLEEQDYTTLDNSLHQGQQALLINMKKFKPNKKFAIVESHQSDKKKICKEKSHTCKKSFPTIESLQTLDQVSTLEGRALEPFWSCQAKDLSQRLWLPIETGCVASRSNWLSGSFSSMESNSWFSMKTWTPQNNQNLQKISYPLSMFSIAGSMAKVNTKKQRKNKIMTKQKAQSNACRRVRLRPDPETASILRRWFGCVRVTYNWALSCIKDKPKEYKINVIWLRKRFVNACNIPKDKSWLLNTPKHVRDTAIKDLVLGYENNFRKKKDTPNHKFQMKFRRKKDYQSITIPSDAVKDWDSDKESMIMFPTFLKNRIKFHCRKVPKEVSYDCRLTLDRLGRFYLCIPYVVPACENQTGREQCSIDPGVRTFLTVYSPKVGTSYKIGNNDICRIFRLCKWLDKLCNGKKISRKKRLAQYPLRMRIKTLVDEVHWKAINYLCRNFKEIIIPPFEVSQMVKKANRKIRKKSVRQMLCWRHFTFRQRLLAYAKRTGVQVHVLGEEYTSKTCSNCMSIKSNLGGSKVYRCQHCSLVGDRDLLGARNIFIKNASAL